MCRLCAAGAGCLWGEPRHCQRIACQESHWTLRDQWTVLQLRRKWSIWVVPSNAFAESVFSYGLHPARVCLRGLDSSHQPHGQLHARGSAYWRPRPLVNIRVRVYNWLSRSELGGGFDPVDWEMVCGAQRLPVVVSNFEKHLRLFWPTGGCESVSDAAVERYFLTHHFHAFFDRCLDMAPPGTDDLRHRLD